MEIRLAADLQQDSIVDGEGIRTVIWTQGCPHNCLGCHNPITHDFEGGALVDIELIKKDIDELDGQDGITFSGGDPFIQPLACSILAKHAKEKGLNIWCYTGYTFEHLLELAKVKSDIKAFLDQIDVLVDGKFEISKKSYSAVFRGSTNQRIIDVKKSLKAKKAVLIEKYIIKEENTTKKRPGIYI